MNTDTERRRFHRVLFQMPTELRQKDRIWQCQLLDLSLQGLLVTAPEDWQVLPDEPVQAVIRLAENAVITMHVNPARRRDRQLGLECEAIDIDSISHLRRLLELNLSDPAALQRDLCELAACSSY